MGIPIPFLHRNPLLTGGGLSGGEGGDPKYAEPRRKKPERPPILIGVALETRVGIRLGLQMRVTGRVTGESEAEILALLEA